MSSGRQPVTREAIDEIVRVVVDRVSPRRVVLFGSAARGDKEQPADVDLMVVVDEDADRRSIAADLYRAMYEARIGIGVDFVVATETGFERHRDTAGLVYRDIARDGREVYVAARPGLRGGLDPIRRIGSRGRLRAAAGRCASWRSVLPRAAGGRMAAVPPDGEPRPTERLRR